MRTAQGSKGSERRGGGTVESLALGVTALWLGFRVYRLGFIGFGVYRVYRVYRV